MINKQQFSFFPLSPSGHNFFHVEVNTRGLLAGCSFFSFLLLEAQDLLFFFPPPFSFSPLPPHRIAANWNPLPGFPLMLLATVCPPLPPSFPCK